MLVLRSEASRAIANLLTSFGSHSSIIIDGVPGIVHLALSQDAECQYHAAIALRKLAPNLSSHEAIVNADGIKSLFHLTAMKDIKLRRQAAVALRDLAANPDHKVSGPALCSFLLLVMWCVCVSCWAGAVMCRCLNGLCVPWLWRGCRSDSLRTAGTR